MTRYPMIQYEIDDRISNDQNLRFTEPPYFELVAFALSAASVFSAFATVCLAR
jgi:hypothetical protein